MPRSRLVVRVALALSLSSILVGCSLPEVEPLMPTPALYSETGATPLAHIPPNQRWTPRKVYFATTRERSESQQRVDYGNRQSSHVSVGLAMIGFGGPDMSRSDLDRASSQAEREASVPLSMAGLLEAGRFSITPTGQLEDASGTTAWLLDDLNASIAASRSPDLLIYVHGAKVNFYNANVFAAQLDHFMGRDMTSVAFAWPTRQNIFSYGLGDDLERAYRNAPALSTLLELLADRSIAERIHIVTWSAGGRLVTEALAQLHERHADEHPDLRERFRLGTIYFAAADVPGSEFIEALPRLEAIAERLVVTASSNDGALRMARRFMRGDERIGQIRSEALSDEQLETIRSSRRLEVIDVSRGSDQRGFDITGHRYWFNHPWASSDVVLAIRGGLAAGDRALQPEDLAVLWSIPSDYPHRLSTLLQRAGVPIRQDN
ncbi:alpha/beta hydrolase [Wenzhouxiangella marina]|nr:alpha/beta hydrolase [Wenzhouxiangella marina]MBB6086605.1 esterase/lipase superfamily enzyme [Wenzhouxiangella marina]